MRLQEASCTELLSHSVSFLRAARGVAAFFKDAQKANAIIVLDGAEILLSSVASESIIHQHDAIVCSVNYMTV